MSEFNLASNLRELRITNEYTQQYVSDQIHIARQTYSLYEKGKRLPDLKSVCALADLFHVSVDVLLHTDLVTMKVAESPASEHTALLPGNSSIRLNGAEARMIMDYKELSPEAQREIREFVRFKKKLEKDTSK